MRVFIIYLHIYFIVIGHKSYHFNHLSVVLFYCCGTIITFYLQNFSSCKPKHLHSLSKFSISFSLQPLATATPDFFLSLNLTIPVSHISGTTQYFSFGNGFVSLSTKSSRFIRVVAGARFSLLSD